MRMVTMTRSGAARSIIDTSSRPPVGVSTHQSYISDQSWSSIALKSLKKAARNGFFGNVQDLAASSEDISFVIRNGFSSLEAVSLSKSDTEEPHPLRLTNPLS